MSVHLRKSGRPGRPRHDDAFAYYVMIEAERRRSGLSLNAFSRSRRPLRESGWVEDHFADEAGKYRLQVLERDGAALRRKWYRARRELGLDRKPLQQLGVDARAQTERAIAELLAG